MRSPKQTSVVKATVGKTWSRSSRKSVTSLSNTATNNALKKSPQNIMIPSKNNPSTPDFVQLHRSIQTNNGVCGTSGKPIIYRSFHV